jgi:hypothetical protein
MLSSGHFPGPQGAIKPRNIQSSMNAQAIPRMRGTAISQSSHAQYRKTKKLVVSQNSTLDASALGKSYLESLKPMREGRIRNF